MNQEVKCHHIPLYRMKIRGLFILLISLLAACAKEPLYETHSRNATIIYIDNKPITITADSIDCDTVFIINSNPFYK
ncbi:MAG: hypothetical protein IPO03_16210 [Bacteroidetes bacterium]|nr:hypothetical protein [Bacteroidota bacterium]MBL0282114.1 hypothetical protein [Bacteroidota bacterium]